MKRLATYAGALVLAGCLFFLGWQVYEKAGELKAADIPGAFVAVCLGLAIAHGVLQFLHVGALQIILRGLGVRSAGFAQVLDLHGRSNVGKYLPGNMFHYVGRQVIAVRYGWPQWAVASASVSETALVAISATLLSIAFGYWSGYLTAVLDVELSFLPAIALVCVGALTLWAIGCFAGRLPLAGRIADTAAIQRFCRSPAPLLAAVCYLAFLLATGVFFWAMLAALRGDWSPNHVALSVFVYVLSWFAGYATPAAPGGVGVREAILVLLLGEQIGGANALVLAVALRLVTVLGDGVLFLFALWVWRRGAEADAPTPRVYGA